MTPSDGMVVVSFSTTTLWAALAVGLPGFGAGAGFLLRWFLARLDEKETKYQTHLDDVVEKFDTMAKRLEVRATAAETRSLGIHDRAVTTMESLKSGFDRMVTGLAAVNTRLERLEDDNRDRPQPRFPTRRPGPARPEPGRPEPD